MVTALRAAALALGADGVSVGTRLVATVEADAMAEYKQALVSGNGIDTVRTHVFGPQWPDFNPMRVLRTPLVDAYHGRIAEIPKDTAGEPICARLPFCGQALEMHRFDAFVPAEGTTGDAQQMPLLAGEGVGPVREIEPAADVVRAMSALGGSGAGAHPGAGRPSRAHAATELPHGLTATPTILPIPSSPASRTSGSRSAPPVRRRL